MNQLASVCNRYPSIELLVEVQKPAYSEGETAELKVTLSRADVEDEADLAVFQEPVFAQYYPLEKEEQWWLVVGQPKNNKLLSIKKISNFKAQQQITQQMSF